VGAKDSVTHEYMKQPEQFADVFNGALFNGEEIIDPKKLREMSTNSIALPFGKDGAAIPKQKERDLLKMVMKTDGKAAYCILGVENQGKVHGAMAVRNMLYDALTLTDQVKAAAKSHRQAGDTGKDEGEFLSGFHSGDRLLPVITMVIYWGTGEWDAPLRLRDMYLKDVNPRLLDYTADYKVNLVSPAQMSDAELDTFKSDLKEVLKFIKHSADKNKLRKLLDEDKKYQKLDRLAAQTISACSGVDFNIPVGEEEVNVCKAIEDMKIDAWKEGHNEGRNEERNEGISKAISMFKNLKLTKEVAIQQIGESYALSSEEAAALVNSRW